MEDIKQNRKSAPQNLLIPHRRIVPVCFNMLHNITLYVRPFVRCFCLPIRSLLRLFVPAFDRSFVRPAVRPSIYFSVQSLIALLLWKEGITHKKTNPLYLEPNSNNEMFCNVRVLEAEATFRQLSSQHSMLCMIKRQYPAHQLPYTLAPSHTSLGTKHFCRP